MTPTLPVHPLTREGLVLDAHLHLLDRQVLDAHDVPVSCVADLEIGEWRLGELPRPVVTFLIVGSGLWQRMLGMHPPPTSTTRIDWHVVSDIGTVVRLMVPGSALEVTWVTRWLAERIIDRIPGAPDAAE